MSQSPKERSNENTQPSSTSESKTSFRDGEAGPEDQALAELQNEIQDLKNDRNEERFLLLVIIIILLDAFIFSFMANWAGALVIGIIEIFGIAVIARRWRIEEVPQMLSKFLDRASERVSPPSANNRPTDGTGEKP